jgi:peptide/nickel transport system substrate-binding protein
MNFNRRHFNQMALLAGLGFALPAGASLAQEATPTAGGTLNIVYFPEPTQLVAINTSAGGPQFIGSKLFDGLVSYDHKLNPLPQIAESWTISPDGLEYVFKLRPGIKFHDGSDLTSADVAFSIRAAGPPSPM